MRRRGGTPNNKEIVARRATPICTQTTVPLHPLRRLPTRGNNTHILHLTPHILHLTSYIIHLTSPLSHPTQPNKNPHINTKTVIKPLSQLSHNAYSLTSPHYPTLITDGKLHHRADGILEGILIDVEFCRVVNSRCAKIRVLNANKREKRWSQLVV